MLLAYVLIRGPTEGDAGARAVIGSHGESRLATLVSRLGEDAAASAEGGGGRSD